MPCYRPILGYRARVPNESGKRSIVFNPRKGMVDEPVNLPCGQCIGCRLERSRQWAVRMTHEASLYEKNCFITLTYNQENLPKNGSLILDDFQKFMKRLRKEFSDEKIRFFHCGEYGEKFGRPHYHACLFNFEFSDRYPWRKAQGGEQVYRSPTLERLWPFGNSEIGSLTFESAAYVARYITKKITGEAAEKHYGERRPEYTTMSRRPGIGKGWFDLYASDLFPSDECVVRGKIMKPPQYYFRRYEIDNPSAHEYVKDKRSERAKELEFKNPSRRLADCEAVKEKQSQLLIRGYENDTKSVYSI